MNLSIQQASSWLGALMLICWACECPDSNQKPKSPHQEVLALFEPWPECGTQAKHERWHRIRFFGRDSGARHFQLFECQRGNQPRWQLLLTEYTGFTRLGQRIELVRQQRVSLDAQGRLMRIRELVNQFDTQVSLIQAGRIADEMVTIAGPEKITVPFESESVDSVLFASLRLSKEVLVAGEVFRFRSFSAKAAGFVDNTIKIVDSSDLAGMLRIEHTSSDQPGVRTLIDLDRARLPYQMEANAGRLRISYQPVEQACSPLIPAEVPELESLMSLTPSGQRIPHPDLVESVNFVLQGTDSAFDLSQLSGPGQEWAFLEKPRRVRVRSFRINKPIVDKGLDSYHSLVAASKELQKQLASTALAPSDDPQIVKLAQRLTHEQATPWLKAIAIRNWIAKQIRSDMGQNFSSAKQVLSSKRGDCSEKSVLLSALARACGIPSRSIVGLVYQNGKLMGHMWNEVWVGSWRLLDAALGDEQVSPARIRLAVHPLQLSADAQKAISSIMLLLSGVRISIEDVKIVDKL